MDHPGNSYSGESIISKTCFTSKTGLEYLKRCFLYGKWSDWGNNMKRVEDVIDGFDRSDPTEKKKILLIEWFQKHPGKRFDISEVHRELREELDVGRTRTGQILKELDEEDSVLTSYGKKRKAYELSEDILVPVKYQTLAGLRHLWMVVDVQRWGVVGFAVVTTVLWFFLTFPFWFLTLFLLVSPQNRLGPVAQSEFAFLSLIMTIWLVIAILFTSTLQMVRRWWKKRSPSD